MNKQTIKDLRRLKYLSAACVFTLAPVLLIESACILAPIFINTNNLYSVLTLLLTFVALPKSCVLLVKWAWGGEENESARTNK